MTNHSRLHSAVEVMVRKCAAGFCWVCAVIAPVLPATLGQAADRIPPPLKDLGKQDKIRLVYFVPADREPVAHWQEKIVTVMTFVADLYREDFKSRGWKGGELDFFWEEGSVKVELIRSPKKASELTDNEMNSHQQWLLVKKEIARTQGSFEQGITVVFSECYGDGPAAYEWPSGIARGAKIGFRGGLGIFSAWLLRDEFAAITPEAQLKLLADETPVKGRAACHGRKPDSPRFEFIEDGIGAVAHELGHALGLPHDRRDDRHDIMGNGFRHLRGNYLEKYSDPKGRVGFSTDNARLLANTRHLAEKPAFEDDQAPEVRMTVSSLLPHASGDVRIRIEATDDMALGAAVVLQKRGAAGYYVVGGMALEGTDQNKEITVPLDASKPGEAGLSVLVTDRSGRTAKALIEEARIISGYETLTDAAARKIEGNVVRSDANAVTFRKRSDEKEFVIPLSRLAAGDAAVLTNRKAIPTQTSRP